MSELVNKAKNYVSETVSNFSKPDATLSDVDFKELCRDGANFHAKISVDNPYSVPIPICEASYKLMSAGKLIASGTIPDPGSLKSKGTTHVDVPVKVAYSVLASLAKDVATDWDIDYQLDVVLIIDIPVFGDLRVPLSTKGEIKLPSIKDYFKK